MIVGPSGPVELQLTSMPVQSLNAVGDRRSSSHVTLSISSLGMDVAAATLQIVSGCFTRTRSTMQDRSVDLYQEWAIQINNPIPDYFFLKIKSNLILHFILVFYSQTTFLCFICFSPLVHTYAGSHKNTHKGCEKPRWRRSASHQTRGATIERGLIAVWCSEPSSFSLII